MTIIVVKLGLTIILLSGFLIADPPSKKEVLLSITRKYLPDNYAVLKQYDEATINMLAPGDSIADFVFEYPTIIHEAFHTFESLAINSYFDTVRKYRLDDTTIIGVKKFRSFPSKLVSEIVPKNVQKEIMRYNLYINDTSNGTQQDGFLGLLEEYAAYYQSLKAYTSTYYFLKDNFAWSRPKIWVDYLNIGGSEIYAINEFRLFFSWYLQYSKLKRPEVYRSITADKNIKSIYTKIELNSQKLINTFLENRSRIMSGIQPFIEMSDGFARIKGTSKGYGIDEHIKMLNLTERLLAEPQHHVLDELRL